MHKLFKHLLKEEYHYYSDKPIDEVRAEMHALLLRTQGWNFSVNLTGDFIAENEFEMFPKWQFITTNGAGKTVILKGSLKSESDNKTKVIFTVKPSLTFAILSIAFPLFGIFAAVSFFQHNADQETLIVGLAFIVIIPPMMIFVSRYVKNELKNRFVSVFKLKNI